MQNLLAVISYHRDYQSRYVNYSARVTCGKEAMCRKDLRGGRNVRPQKLTLLVPLVLIPHLALTLLMEWATLVV
jgi:hypothetical protein